MYINRYTLIAGPTASGKSSLAIEIAQKTGAAIINADALQVYREYQILTARPSEHELRQAPHYLYGHIGSDAGYSVGAWLREVERLISEFDQPLIIIGGTGLYFSALLDGLSDIPAIKPEVRENLQSAFEQNGIAYLQAQLEKSDPIVAKRIDMQNPRRVMRALEVFLSTGKPLSAWQDETPPPILRRDEVTKFLLMPSVETTNERIERRFDVMLETGAIEEVEAQLENWEPSSPANQALGAKEIAQYLRGETPLEQAREMGVTATRQYAKRQRTWFRSRMKDWVTKERAKDFRQEF